MLWQERGAKKRGCKVVESLACFEEKVEENLPFGFNKKKDTKSQSTTKYAEVGRHVTSGIPMMITITMAVKLSSIISL